MARFWAKIEGQYFYMLEKLIEIDDIDSPETKIFSHLDDRVFKDNNYICCDGQKLTLRLLQSPYQCHSILAVRSFYEENKELIQEKAGNARLYCAPKKIVESIVGYRLHKGVIAVGERPSFSTLSELDDRILILNDVQNSENVGAIVRSAHAFGIRSIIVDVTGCSPFVRRSARVSMGSIFKMKVHQSEDLVATIEGLKSLGYLVVATGDEHPKTQKLSDVSLPQKGALIVGNEGHGVSEEVINASHLNVRIETSEDIDSLNAAIAGSLLLYEWNKNILSRQ